MNDSLNGLNTRRPQPLPRELSMGMLAFFLVIGCLFLSACQDQKDLNDVEITVSSDVDAALGRTLERRSRTQASQLLRRYFGTRVVARRYSPGPAGTLHIEAVESDGGGARELYMLPDQQHLIEGTLYSPYLPRPTLLSPRQASDDNRHAAQDTLRRALSTGPVEQPAPAMATSGAEQATPSASVATAPLPAVNQVVDREALYGHIEKADWIAEGDSNKVLYVFFDFRCPACREVHGHLQDYIQRGEVEVRYLPVGALGDESAERASLSLVPTDNNFRLKLMKKLMRPDDLDDLIETPPPAQDKRRGQIAALKNFKILIDTQRVATPTFAYRTANGARISQITSVKELQVLIDEIAGT